MPIALRLAAALSLASLLACGRSPTPCAQDSDCPVGAVCCATVDCTGASSGACRYLIAPACLPALPAAQTRQLAGVCPDLPRQDSGEQIELELCGGDPSRCGPTNTCHVCFAAPAPPGRQSFCCRS